MTTVVNNKKGTALLVALLVMGVLMSISLALSTLIIREISITKDAIDSGRAFYAAESGVEIALYELEDNLPGWDTMGKYKSIKLDDDYEVVGEYLVNNKCSSYPCYDDTYDGTTDLTSYYDVLDLNESITIPLFTIDGITNKELPVEDFTVEFYMGFNPATDLKIIDEDINNLSSWDVLRWKVFGINKEGKEEKTYSISDFTAVSTAYYSFNGEELNTSALKPSWFGTVGCGSSEVDQDSRVTTDITCFPYNTFVGGASASKNYDNPDMWSAIVEGVCLNTEAREYYDYSSLTNGKIKDEDVKVCYPIGNFLDTHKLKYLTLTNMVNPLVFNSGVNKEDLQKIYYRVEFFDDKTERNFAEITSNGYSGDSRQSISVKIQKGSLMPVFNFSLYSTYKKDQHKDKNGVVLKNSDGNVITGEEYFYGEE